MSRSKAVQVVLILLVSPLTACAATITIVDWNIYSYNDSASSEYAALVRIVQAINPDILLLDEAQNPTGRDAFLAQFAARYPYQFLGAPASDNPRCQIVSAFPLVNTRQIFTADPLGGTFERPTIVADVDVLPLEPGTELRLYAAHLKSGTVSRDNTLRLNQATDDAADISAFVAANPGAWVFYAGDLNCEIGDAPLNKLLETATTLTRLTILNPNTGSAMTRYVSGKTIDHMLYSSALAGRLHDQYIFYSNTYPAGTVPPPALSTDSETASDHLTLVVKMDILEHPPAEGLRLNEVYADHNGTDTQEFIELSGPPGASLTGMSVLVIEGDADSTLGRVDSRWNLDGYVIPANGYFVLGDTAVARKNLDIGSSNQLENGTETILLVRGATVAQGADIDTDNDGVADVSVGVVEDSLGLVDGGINTGDHIYYGAPQFGPHGSAIPAGAARVPDSVGPWARLSFMMDGSDGDKVPSPGLSNSPGDFDRDGDVDLDDFGVFQRGLSGPQIPSVDARTDLDGDGDTDLNDFGIFQAHITGPR